MITDNLLLTSFNQRQVLCHFNAYLKLQVACQLENQSKYSGQSACAKNLYKYLIENYIVSFQNLCQNFKDYSLWHTEKFNVCTNEMVKLCSNNSLTIWYKPMVIFKRNIVKKFLLTSALLYSNNRTALKKYTIEYHVHHNI